MTSLLLSAVASSALFACGGGGEPISGVLHLDLRLANGESPSAALAAALPALELRPDGDDPKSLGAWTIEGGALAPTPRGGARLVPASPDASPTLKLARDLDASTYPALEILAETRKQVDVRVAWDGDQGPGEMVLPLNPGERPRRVRFALGAIPTWRGTIERLTVTTMQEGASPVALHELRLLPDGFVWGHEPLEEELGTGDGGARGDAGLRTAGRLARRAWPSDVDIPLFASVDAVPRGGWLSTSVAATSRAMGRGETLYATVDVRNPGGSWRRLTDVEAPTRARRWTEVSADLGDWAGEAIELRFLVHTEADAAVVDDVADAAPREELLLWGAPEVLGDQPASRRPNLVLITLDTCRADALKTGDSVFAPFLAELANESIVFTDAWSSCNATSPSHASLLTGMHVEEHGVVSNRHLLAPEIETITETLRDAGYHTAAAVSVPHIQAGTGFGQGFDEFAIAIPGAEIDGALAVDAVEKMISDWGAGPARPVFLWIHLFDPHTPYSPPEEFVERFLADTGLQRPPRKDTPATIPVWAEDDRPIEEIPPAARWHRGVTSLASMRFSYHLGVAYTDHLCERIFESLDASGMLDHSGVLLTADHGESLGEHNVWFDHAGLFRETLEVPLYLRLPGGAMGGEKVATRSTGVDVAPTLLTLAGLRPPASMPGVDLAAVARGTAEVPADRRVWFAFSDMHQVGFHDSDAHFFTTLTDRLRYGTSLVLEDGRAVPRRGDPIPKGKHFLYDPANDPGLTVDVSEDEPRKTASSSEALDAWRAALERRDVERRDVSAEEEANLEAMGYAGD